MIKFILGSIGIILALCFAGILIPSILGIIFGIIAFRSGSIGMGIFCIVAGIGINIAMVVGGAIEGGFGSGGTGSRSHSIDHECPNCGSSDTDGNHCFDCNDDF